jgi:RNA polymerase sigma-70 factor, ECF subfamily
MRSTLERSNGPAGSLTTGRGGHRLLFNNARAPKHLRGPADKSLNPPFAAPRASRRHAQAGLSANSTQGANVIIECIAGGTETIGFRSKTSIDDSPETQRRTRLAVARAKEGDREAIRYLYLTYSHNVYGFVRSIVRDDHEAEDVTQHVFAKLMTAIGRYDERGVPFMAWLLRLARNLAIDHLRANRLTPVEEVLDPDAGSSLDIDHRELVRDALAGLPQDQREVVVLRHVMGYSPREIARRTGRTESSVHGLHHRGRRTLQRELLRLDAAPLTHHSGGPLRVGGVLPPRPGRSIADSEETLAAGR